MDRPELRLVSEAPSSGRSLDAAVVGAAILAAALLATFLGADAARRPFNPATVAEDALARSLSANDPSIARRALDGLFARLRAIPLDAASRTIAASLMAETADTEAARQAAADQAQTATRLVSSDEWIGRGVASVLARCGRREDAIHEVARIFTYAPEDGAAALADVEPFLAPERVESALPAAPDAWLAWSLKLRTLGREGEADARLAKLLTRWPQDLHALGVAASVAISRDRIDDLARLVPPSLALPETRDAAVLHACRARSKAANGDVQGAKEDALHAIELSRGDPWILTIAGDTVAPSDADLARELWSRAIYRLSAQDAAGNSGVWIRARLARLDEREGRAGDALRRWREILDAHPDDGEARRRVGELTGASLP